MFVAQKMEGSSAGEVSSIFWQRRAGKSEVFELDVDLGEFFELCETLLSLYATSDDNIHIEK